MAFRLWDLNDCQFSQYAVTRHQGAIMNFELEFALAGTLKPPVEIGAGPFAPI
jgi:hypothetical protein